MSLSRSLLPAILCSLLAASAAPLSAQNAGANPPPAVITGKPVRVEEAAAKRYVGVVESIRHVDIMPRVTGTLLNVHFTEGGMVKAGDLLYDLEDTTYKANVNALRAQKAQLEAALRYADLEFKRSSTLLESNAVAVSAHDKARLDIDTATAKLQEISAALTDAENTLSYTKIHAPLTGRIGKSTFTAGSLITPNGGKLNDIDMIAPIYVKFSLSEPVFRRELGGSEGAKTKARIRIQLADGAVYSETAKITLIDNKISTATDSITVWATFQNKDFLLIPGSFVTVLVSVKPEKPFVAIVPSALVAEESGMCVYVIGEDKKAERRPVEIGSDAGKGLIVVTSGLTGDETIVVEGAHKVVPGFPVSPVPQSEVK